MTDGAATHCPYCALQCAMTLTPRSGSDPGCPAGVRPRAGPTPAAAAPTRRSTCPAATSPPTAAGCARRAGRSRVAARATRAALTDAAAARRRRRARARSAGTRPSTLVADAVERTRARARRGRRRRSSAAAGSPTRRPTSWASSPGVALGTSQIDYNGRFCMSSAAAAGIRAFGLDRGLPFPLADLGARQRHPAARLQRRRDHAALRPAPRRARATPAGSIVVDPRRSATAALTADGGGLHLQPLPGTDLALLLGCSTS